MDKIWYRNPSKSEVIGHCGGDEKNEKSRTLKKNTKKQQLNVSKFESHRSMFPIDKK